MSVRKTLGLVKHAATEAGIEWPESSHSSAKKQRIEEPEEEKHSIHLSEMIGSDDLHRL